MQKVNIAQKLSLFTDHWHPRIVGELNNQHVKLVKLKGTLAMELRDQTIAINEQEFLIVPKGVEHKPVADEEVWLMLFEPATTLNTGDAKSNLTREKLEVI